MIITASCQVKLKTNSPVVINDPETKENKTKKGNKRGKKGRRKNPYWCGCVKIRVFFCFLLFLTLYKRSRHVNYSRAQEAAETQSASWPFANTLRRGAKEGDGQPPKCPTTRANCPVPHFNAALEARWQLLLYAVLPSLLGF